VVFFVTYAVYGGQFLISGTVELFEALIISPVHVFATNIKSKH
jgi:hypothetical protein